jgi:hypothetical protein
MVALVLAVAIPPERPGQIVAARSARYRVERV